MEVAPHLPPNTIKKVAQAFAPGVDEYGNMYPVTQMGYTIVNDPEAYAYRDSLFHQIDKKTGKTFLEGWKQWWKEHQEKKGG